MLGVGVISGDDIHDWWRVTDAAQNMWLIQGHSPVAYEEWRRPGLGADGFDPDVWAIVRLGVDSENPTGATRLYERAGMHVESETVTLQKQLP